MHLKRRREELEHFILELSKSHKDAQVDCCVGEKGVWALVPSEDGKSLRTGARNKHGDLDQIKQILIAGMVDGRIPVEHQGSQVMLQFRMMHQVNGWSSKTGKIDHLSISFWQV